ncbi:MAG TPA: hypothetical protein VJ810_29500 [Blastocatellia bacterium]|nr:hypothetical protein [Blastocatellia bacterium]
MILKDLKERMALRSQKSLGCWDRFNAGDVKWMTARRYALAPVGHMLGMGE